MLIYMLGGYSRGFTTNMTVNMQLEILGLFQEAIKRVTHGRKNELKNLG